MLTVTQKVTFNGTSAIDGTTAVRYYAQIDVDNPEKLSLSHTVLNGDLYRDNREEIEKEGAEFDDTVLATQAEMEQQDAKVENVETDEEDVETDDENVETEEEVEQ